MFFAVGVIFVTLLLILGVSMVVRFGLRRRIGRAQSQLPVNEFSGTALLVGTNFDPDLRGIGAMAITEDSLVFIGGSDQRSLHIPRLGLTARPHRRKANQRKPSLRVEWAGNIAQFEVDRPTVDQWVDHLNQ